jgi:hypothetical protein
VQPHPARASVSAWTAGRRTAEKIGAMVDHAQDIEILDPTLVP